MAAGARRVGVRRAQGRRARAERAVGVQVAGERRRRRVAGAVSTPPAARPSSRRPRAGRRSAAQRGARAAIVGLGADVGRGDLVDARRCPCAAARRRRPRAASAPVVGGDSVVERRSRDGVVGVALDPAVGASSRRASARPGTSAARARRHDGGVHVDAGQVDHAGRRRPGRARRRWAAGCSGQRGLVPAVAEQHGRPACCRGVARPARRAPRRGWRAPVRSSPVSAKPVRTVCTWASTKAGVTSAPSRSTTSSAPSS